MKFVWIHLRLKSINKDLNMNMNDTLVVLIKIVICKYFVKRSTAYLKVYYAFISRQWHQFISHSKEIHAVFRLFKMNFMHFKSLSYFMWEMENFMPSAKRSIKYYYYSSFCLNMYPMVNLNTPFSLHTIFQCFLNFIVLFVLSTRVVREGRCILLW